MIKYLDKGVSNIEILKVINEAQITSVLFSSEHYFIGSWKWAIIYVAFVIKWFYIIYLVNFISN